MFAIPLDAQGNDAITLAVDAQGNDAIACSGCSRERCHSLQWMLKGTMP